MDAEMYSKMPTDSFFGLWMANYNVNSRPIQITSVSRQVSNICQINNGLLLQAYNKSMQTVPNGAVTYHENAKNVYPVVEVR